MMSLAGLPAGLLSHDSYHMTPAPPDTYNTVCLGLSALSLLRVTGSSVSHDTVSYSMGIFHSEVHSWWFTWFSQSVGDGTPFGTLQTNWGVVLVIQLAAAVTVYVNSIACVVKLSAIYSQNEDISFAHRALFTMTEANAGGIVRVYILEVDTVKAASEQRTVKDMVKAATEQYTARETVNITMEHFQTKEKFTHDLQDSFLINSTSHDVGHHILTQSLMDPNRCVTLRCKASP